MNSYDSVHAYWFGDTSDWLSTVTERHAMWFSVDSDRDREIEDQFANYVDSAAAGSLDHWLGSARGALCLTIVLDQFPRNIYRGDARAFALDSQALAVAEHAIAANLHLQLCAVEQVFLYLPFEHAESLAKQDRCLELFTEAASNAPENLKEYMAQCIEYARMHQEIIARFGRFPHRNEVLNRTSTAEELDYLQGDAVRFGQ